MIRIIEPNFQTFKELKNLNIFISHYSDNVSIQLKNKSGFLVFYKSYSGYDKTAINEISKFIEVYDNKIENKMVSEIDNLYFEISNYFNK